MTANTRMNAAQDDVFLTATRGETDGESTAECCSGETAGVVLEGTHATSLPHADNTQGTPTQTGSTGTRTAVRAGDVTSRGVVVGGTSDGFSGFAASSAPAQSAQRNATVAIRLRPGPFQRALVARVFDCLDGSGGETPGPDERYIQLAPGLPRLRLVGLQGGVSPDESYLLCRMPEHVLNKTIAWGHTAWCSTLVRPEITQKVYCGVRFTDAAVEHTLKTLLVLSAVTPICTIAQMTTLAISTNYSLTWIAPLGAFGVLIEGSAVIMAVGRHFQALFRFWLAAAALCSVTKLCACGLELGAILAVKTNTCRVAALTSTVSPLETTGFGDSRTALLGPTDRCIAESSFDTWLQIASLIAGVISFSIGCRLQWVARKLRQFIKAEQARNRVLLSVERPGKILSSRPILFWLIGSPPFRSSRTLKSARLSASEALG